MFKQTSLLFLLSLSSFLYGEGLSKKLFSQSFPLTFLAKTNVEFGQKLDIDYDACGEINDSSFAPSTKRFNTYSFAAELFTKVWRFDLGTGIGYQVPTSSGDLGDFYFIPVYFLSNLHLYQKEEKFDIYAIYQQGVTYQKGSHPYNTGDLEDGNYLGYGLGVKLFSDFHLEFMVKNYRADNSEFKHEYQTTNSEGKTIDQSDVYDLKTDYQTFSIGFGISNLFDDFLYHLY